MSTIKVDTIATRTGSGNITLSNTLVGNLTGNLTGNVTGDTTGTHTGNVATNSITTASGSTITIPTGKTLVGTDANTFIAPNHVVQTKFQVASRTVTTSTSYALMNGYNLAITPTSTSSKILITYCYHVFVDSTTANVWRGALVRLMNVTTDTVLSTDSAAYGESSNFNNTNDRYMTYASSQFIDSPNTTSAVTYGLECRSKSGSSIDFNYTSYGRGGSIRLEEIAQ